MKISRLWALIPAVLAAVIVLSPFQSAVAADSASDSDWQYSASLYLWMPGIKGGSASGADFDMDFRSILDNLKMTFMGSFEARKSNLSLLADVVYLNVGGSSVGSIPIPSPGPGEPSVKVDADVKIKSTVLSLLAGYTLLQTEKTTLDVIGGARYLDMEVDFDVTKSLGPKYKSNSETADGNVWDAVVGIRGRSKLDKNWYIPYHLDIGTGASDLTWQLMGGVGYNFDWGDVAFVYRHMEWEFDDNSALKDIRVSGPLLLGTYNF